MHHDVHPEKKSRYARPEERGLPGVNERRTTPHDGIFAGMSHPPRAGRELTPYFDSIERLQLSVAVANYRGSEYSNTTEPEIFDLTQ